MKIETLLSILAGALATAAAFGDPAPDAPKEFEILQLVTGFHSHRDQHSGFEFRILEMDGSATVALNPIFAYLVVTNDAPGDDLQSRIVALPRLAEIKAVRFLKGGNLRIEAMIERSNAEGSETWKEATTVAVSIPIEKNRLPEKIDVVLKPDRAEDVQSQ